MSVERPKPQLINPASPNIDPDVQRWFLDLTPDQRMQQLEQLWRLLGLIRPHVPQNDEHAEHPETNH